MVDDILAEQLRQKAQGSTDHAFLMHVAGELERRGRRIHDLKKERDALRQDSERAGLFAS